MRRRNKKGQFFLVMAVIIIVVAAGFITLTNFSEKREGVKLSYIGDELKIESEKVLDYISLKGNRDSTMDNFTKEFSNYTKENVKIYYIEGKNDESIKVYTWDKNSEGENINMDNNLTITEQNTIEVDIQGEIYSFNKTRGENFYFVMISEKEDEKYIIK